MFRAQKEVKQLSPSYFTQSVQSSGRVGKLSALFDVKVRRDATYTDFAHGCNQISSHIRPALDSELGHGALVSSCAAASAGVTEELSQDSGHYVLEPLLRHLSPGAVPESCWTQLRRILADRPAQMGEEAAEAVKEEMQVPAAELAELSATFQKLHRITTELSRPVQNMDEVLLPLRQAAQILLRPQAHGPLRGFLRRLRLRRGAKENVVPQTKTGRLQKPPADDYACAREQAADEGLVGAFPSSLFGPLRRLLAGPAPVQRGAAEVVAACARACGAPLLRGLLGLAPLLLKVVSFRGPAQGAARAALAEMSSQSWSGFRATWRALMQAILASSGGRRSPGLSGMVDQGSGQLLEVFRALEEVWPQLSETSDAAAARQ
ncbi:unnamed protein product, partial [Symbiodinium necroappetens]